MNEIVTTLMVLFWLGASWFLVVCVYNLARRNW